MARSTWLLILIKNIYTLWGRKRFILPVTYILTNLIYPFILRVTGIQIFISDDNMRIGSSRFYLNPNKELIRDKEKEEMSAHSLAFALKL